MKLDEDHRRLLPQVAHRTATPFAMESRNLSDDSGDFRLAPLEPAAVSSVQNTDTLPCKHNAVQAEAGFQGGQCHELHDLNNLGSAALGCPGCAASKSSLAFAV